MKLLIVEDEADLLKSIVKFFEKEGFFCEQAHNYREGEALISVYDFDCIIIDINLPGGSGLSLLRQLKKSRKEAGVIIISARDTLEDKVKGLELGSDDYLTKPFHLSELNARVKAIIRRKNFDGRNEFEVNEIKVVLDAHKVFVGDEEVPLRKKEYDLLLYLLRNRNRVVTKNSIAEHLWGDYMDGSDTNELIYSHIKNLRKKLVEKGCEDYLQTVYGIGYNFKAL